jgi:predicted metalloprotease with PDZ domain
MYGIVYEKGALLGLFFDLTLRERTNGAITLLSLIRTLTHKFGPDRPFEDSILFSEIESVAGKDIRPFLQTYFDSPTEIPYAEMFAKIGWKYIEEDSVQGFSFSGVRARMDGSNLILNVRKDDNALGAKQGDTVIEVNDIRVDQANEEFDIAAEINDPDSESEITLKVKRGDDIITLKAKPKSTKKLDRSIIRVDEAATEKQRTFLKELLTKQ